MNAENTGTLPVTITAVGVTATGFDPATLPPALPGELKRLTAFGSPSVADDTIHITIRDDSADVYTLRGFAFYLQDGTLFALYGQAVPILEKSTQATLLLAGDIIFADIDAASITFGDTDFLLPPATTEVVGIVELATHAEALTGTDTQRALVPSALKHVLDQRFGAGAPSGFVKGLLTAATALAMRTALELKGAALKDTGAGNGLDADLLDGQHGTYYREWANLTGKPATFPPDAHTHAFASLTGIPATATRWPAWEEVTNKPATFPATAHNHDAAAIVSGTLANARIAVGNVTQHQAALSIAWTQLTGIPTAFPPAAHTHALLTVGAYLTGDDYNGGTARTIAVDATTTATASKIAARDGSGDVFARLFRSEYAVTNASIGFIMTQVETGSGANNYIRPSTPAQVKAALAIVTNDVGGLSAALATKATLNAPASFTTLTCSTMNATASDARLKTDITDLRGCLDALQRFRPRRYRLKADGTHDFGWIAQEHRAACPQAVQRGQDGLLYVRYGKLEPIIVGALQEIAARLDALEDTMRKAA